MRHFGCVDLNLPGSESTVNEEDEPMFLLTYMAIPLPASFPRSGSFQTTCLHLPLAISHYL